jgi:hypothetical protein
MLLGLATQTRRERLENLEKEMVQFEGQRNILRTETGRYSAGYLYALSLSLSLSLS